MKLVEHHSKDIDQCEIYKLNRKANGFTYN